MRAVKALFLILLILAIVLLLSTFWYKDTSSAFEGILTFLSIVTGFAITGMSIIASSSFSKELYKMEVPNDNSKTLLHTLVGKFQNLTIICLLAICCILSYTFLKPYDIGGFAFYETCISLKRVLSSVIWVATMLAVISFLGLISDFSAFIIQSSKRI